MSITLHFDDADAKPLRVDESGTIRVGASRVTLDVLIADYSRGMSPEEIVRQLDTLSLADVYGAIAYYLRHRDEINAYLSERRRYADELQREIEAAKTDRTTLKATLQARIAQRNGGHDSTDQ